MKPLCVFRADAGFEIGGGHIARCLVLADAAEQNGMQVRFICRAERGHLRDLIRKRGYEIDLLPATRPEDESAKAAESDVSSRAASFSEISDADQTIALLGGHSPRYLIVDHYGITSRWHDRLRQYAEKIIVIDDLARNSFNCDVLLNQNLAWAEADYSSKVSKKCRLVLGPQYALLKPEFGLLRNAALEKRKQCQTARKVLISVGGMDPNNLIGAILKELNEIDSFRDMEVTVAVGSLGLAEKELAAQLDKLSFRVSILRDADNMADLMLAADYAIGAAGSSSWERCCLALPSLVFAVADNQIPIARALAAERAVRWLHDSADIRQHIDWGDDYLRHAKNAARICDGQGCARVADILFG